MKVRLVSKQEVYDTALRLSLAIQQSGFVPETVVAIARGGFVPARYICDFLDIDSLAALKIKHYGAGSEKREEAVLDYPLSLDIEGKHVLLADDVNDTGDTLQLAFDHLRSQGPASVKTAVLHEKESTSFKADYAQEVLEKWRWLTYPWARVEDISEFAANLEPRPRTLDELVERLQEKHEMNVNREQLLILRQLGKIELERT